MENKDRPRKAIMGRGHVTLLRGHCKFCAVCKVDLCHDGSCFSRRVVFTIRKVSVPRAPLGETQRVPPPRMRHLQVYLGAPLPRLLAPVPS